MKNDDLGKMPSIRFKGFTNAWEQRKLGEITDSYSGGTPSVGVKEYYGGEIPFIRSAEINSDSTELFITQKGFDNSSARIANIGDILYALYGATSGEVGRARLKGAVNQAILVIQPHTEYYSEFLMQWLRKSKQTIIDTYLQGGQGNLSGTIVKDLVIDCPSQEEQQQIGTFFRNLDNLITLHQRKLDKTKELKKTMLSKMFLKNGEDEPELRFSGFTDAWELRSLGDLLIERNMQIPENEEYPLMSFVQGLGVTPKGDRYDRSFLVTSSEKKYKVTEYGDFIYSSNNLETGSIGFNRTGKAVISPVYSIFYSKSNLESRYIGILATRKDFIAKMIRYRQGVIYGQWRIHESDFLKINILIPSGKEQKEIIQVFDVIDNLITLHQRELEQLINIKKTLLKHMFV